jgi:hypothetical protein
VNKEYENVRHSFPQGCCGVIFELGVMNCLIKIFIRTPKLTNLKTQELKNLKTQKLKYS